ncbi:MAG: hypothetical protein HC836_16910 [Richelia sp. RM2_1_2]|nr:hypothetical protein [Richelia sp. RM2_1_2]
MRYYEVLLEYKTKSGSEITFKVIPDEEGDNNRGWQIDRINAYVDGALAGYLKLGYIPKERFFNHYPSIFNWMTKVQGKSILPHEKRDLHWSLLDDKDKRSLLLRGLMYFSSASSEEQQRIQALEQPQLDEEIKKFEMLTKKELGKKFKEFYNYFVDKPYEDFIRVFSKGDRIAPRQSDEESQRDFKRQGIGLALYFKAADFLNSKGLQMRLSTLRSEEGGKAIGNALIKAGLTTKKGNFEFLDLNKVNAYKQKHGLTEDIIMERSKEEWLVLIARLEAYATSPDRSKEERALYKEKANELRKKIDQEFPEPTKFKDVLPDFKRGETAASYTKTGEFKPFPFKTGSKVNVRT